ncbi:hypothetical protein ZHS_49 [Edwardsiella phage vB_EpM_ZHS]|jgi:hypothetical protein|nr:hypothetical protein ZHS_49 [Edwardsiella phage vB_EpM_ZHS]
MKKQVILAALIAASFSAFADATSESSAGSVAQASPQNIGNPVVNVNSAPQLGYTENKVTHSGLPVSSAAFVGVNAPANDTCNEAGDAISVQAKVFGAAASKGGAMQVACDVRARALNGKYTGRSQAWINATQCQDPNSASATEDEADMIEADARDRGVAVKAWRCPDRLRPQWAKDREASGRKAQAALEAQPMTSAPAPRPQPWQAGG